MLEAPAWLLSLLERQTHLLLTPWGFRCGTEVLLPCCGGLLPSQAVAGLAFSSRRPAGVAGDAEGCPVPPPLD